MCALYVCLHLDLCIVELYRNKFNRAEVKLIHRAVLDLLEQLEMVVLLVYRECLERGASLDLQGPKETE